MGFGKAIELASRELEEHSAKLQRLRDRLINEVEERIPYVKLNGTGPEDYLVMLIFI